MTLTPTVNIYSAPTLTKSSPAVCPQSIVNPPRPDFLYEAEYVSGGRALDLIDPTIEYIKQYGPNPIIRAFTARGLKEGERYLYQDLTNDGVPEFGFAIVGFHILGCVESTYQIMMKTDWDGYLSPAYIYSHADKNHNNIPEILLNAGESTQGGRDYQMFEWNGFDFAPILGRISAYDNDFDPMVFVEVDTDVFDEDIDKDGFQELVFYQGIPIWSTYLDGLPWRRVKDYYRWNGYFYLPNREVFDPPEYLFQAVQDADDASIRADYDKAVSLYQQVIFSDTLKAWSPEWRKYEQDVWLSSMSGDPIPTPPAYDPDEHPNLAAYSRYRIMLLHVLRGYIREAKIVYDTLQEKFPEGQPRHIYAELAQVFWDEYQSSQSIE